MFFFTGRPALFTLIGTPFCLAAARLTSHSHYDNVKSLRDFEGLSQKRYKGFQVSSCRPLHQGSALCIKMMTWKFYHYGDYQPARFCHSTNIPFQKSVGNKSYNQSLESKRELNKVLYRMKLLLVVMHIN